MNTRAPRPIILESAQVVHVRDITPHMRRVVVASDGLIGLSGLMPGIHLKILLPQPGQEKPLLPTFDANGQPLPVPDESRPTVRTYTVRSFEPQTGELAIDFVLHGDEGPASAWATHVQIGNYLGVALRPNIAYREADWYLLAGDQTALPAIGAILEQLPATAKGVAFVEIPDETEEQPLEYDADIQLHWLHRNGIEAGKSSLLQEAIFETVIPDAQKQTRFVWVATEVMATKEIRDYLRMKHRLANHELHAAAYWKLGMTEDAYHELRHREAQQ
ncbi:siderophore-interacting protein [Spirosoma oryzicola]|uniref:siderophore-interacting protein n=1 Tax=Spirosoma oryzicola TaxID=2898794 RepID=UPI001E4752F1|nr:siderophore-interacting protein [Spirosoma oryzicola]UHG91235.1 siderophore-interacting protein [Spirosoma oryzicola]